MDPLLALLIIIVAAYAFGELARAVKVPRVVGQILAGIIIGMPILKEHILGGRNAELISFLADLGILLLFFFVGLQIDMYSFKRYFKEASLISFFNTSLPLVIGFAVMRLMGFSVISSVIVGICLAVSSQSVSVAVLEELKMLKGKIAKLIVTSGAVDDVFELVLISIILALIHASVGGATPVRVVMDVGIFVAVLVAFRYIIIPVLMHLFAQEKSITYLFTGAIIVTLLLAIVTVYLGLGSIVGALFAGIIVREVLLKGFKKEPWEEHNIAKAIHIVSFGFLVPVFFAWVGINTDMESVLGNLWLVLLLVVIAVVGTVIGTMIGVKMHRGGTLKEGYIVGWGLTPKGDVELVIASLALAQGLISGPIYSALIFMALLTTLIAPIVFRHLVKKYHLQQGLG